MQQNDIPRFREGGISIEWIARSQAFTVPVSRIFEHHVFISRYSLVRDRPSCKPGYRTNCIQASFTMQLGTVTIGSTASISRCLERMYQPASASRHAGQCDPVSPSQPPAIIHRLTRNKHQAVASEHTSREQLLACHMV